jgi:hypothetical protein
MIFPKSYLLMYEKVNLYKPQFFGHIIYATLEQKTHRCET